MLRLIRHVCEVGVFAGLVGTAMWTLAMVAGVLGGALIGDLAQSQCFVWLTVLVTSGIGSLLVAKRELDQPRYSM